MTDNPNQNHTRGQSYAYCALAYAVAIAVAAIVVLALEDLADVHPVLCAAVADAAATLVVFAFSVRFGNSSFYDPYWSVGPIVIALYWAITWWPADGGMDYRSALVVGLVALWGVRLTYNFLSGWQGIGHEDWRYVDLQAKFGRAYWLVSFSGIHFVPTILVFLGCLPLYAALSSSSQSLGIMDAVASAVTVAAIGIETLADRQLRTFVKGRSNTGQILTTGLWACSRHPNYVGELLFWWGLFCFALAADPGAWWTGIGALSITILFVFASLPLIENRHRERKTDYAAYAEKTPILIPWFPKQRR